MSRRAARFTVTSYRAGGELARRLVLTEIAFSVRTFPVGHYNKELVEFNIPKRFWPFAQRHRKDVVAEQEFRKARP